MAINEKEISDYPKPITIEDIEVILKQMKISICKICLKNGTKGSGFLCKIPLLGQQKFLKMLITNNHIIGQECLDEESTINAIFENKKIKNIKLKNRKTYTNNKYDITIIEIKEEEELNEDAFLDIDDITIDKSYYGNIGNTVYILQYPSTGNEQKLSMSLGIIKKRMDKEYDFMHFCSTCPGSSGSPIINSLNKKVIGIHKQSAKGELNYNIGAFLNYAIMDYKKLFQSKNNENNAKYTNNPNNENNAKNTFNLNNENSAKKEIITNNLNNIKNAFNSNNLNNKKNTFNSNNINKAKNSNNTNNSNNIDHVKNAKTFNSKNINKANNPNNENNVNNVTIRYKINKSNTIKIFGDDFVKNNKNNCSFIFNGKEKELDAYLNLDKNMINNDSLEIILKIDKNITNMSYIFSGCDSLSSTSDFSKWNTCNVTNMSYMFFGCKSLVELPDISSFNTNNVKDMSSMFHGCESLEKLPNISTWNTSNVTNMNNMFSYCSKLKFLPNNISKWNINKVNDLKCMFYQCSNLESLPDISLWNVINVKDMSYMFYNCKSLQILPELKKWKIQESTKKRRIFYGCSIFLNVPKNLQDNEHY